jgi:hypothetical protein
MSVVSSSGIQLENRVFVCNISQLSSYMKRHCKLRWQFPDVPGPITTIYKKVERLCAAVSITSNKKTNRREVQR